MKTGFCRGVLMILSVCSGLLAHAQENGQPDDSTVLDSSKTEKIRTIEVTPNDKKGEVVVKGDDRLKTMTEFMGTPVAPEPTVRLRGFRLQLLFASDKDAVNQHRADFMSHNPNIPVYVDWLAPNFRLRAGDFRTRLQAEELQFKVKDTFPDAIVVEDWIELPVLKKE